VDSFEALVRLLLEKDGHWTRQSEKVNLSKIEKCATGKPSIPRPEIDVVAFRPSDNKIIAMEVKSLLDSPGVKADHLAKEFETTEGNYKLFTCKNYREIVFQRMLHDYRKEGLADANTQIQLGLAAGKIYSKDEPRLTLLFHERDWLLWSPSLLAKKATALSEIGYENDPFVLLAKLLVRNTF
tara:strand:+ start:445 stop:993 length:549 start_codon:yes stop_codon:yes gene_type:complete